MLAWISFILAILITAALIAIQAVTDAPSAGPDGAGSTTWTLAQSVWWKICIGFAVFAVGVVGNLAANALQKSLDAMPRDAITANKNHHLANLVGESVRVLLLLLVDSKPPPEGMAKSEYPWSVAPSAKPHLTDMAASATDFWRSLVDDPEKVKPFSGLHEPKLSRFIIDPNAPAMDPKGWALFLHNLHFFAANKTGSRAPSFNECVIRDDRETAIAMLGAQFGRSFREALKWDSTHDGLGWAAMQLQISGQLLQRAGAASGSSAETDHALVGLRDAYDTEFKNISKQIAELEESNQRRHQQVLARLIDQHTAVMLALGRLSIRVAAIQEVVGSPTKDVPSLTEGVQRLHDKLDGLKNDSTPEFTNNLALAGAKPNNHFVGRRKELDELAALLNAPNGPAAVAITAGAGFGKTELAKEFINHRAKPATAGVDVAALAPDQWTARWWIDGSKSGEADSLRQHYKAITGRDHPDEPKPAPGENPDAVAAKFRESLRTAVATACSSGRQLLVIDNAETPEQIEQYGPTDRGRLLATSRRLSIPSATAKDFPLDVLDADDARALLAGARADLQTPRHAAALDAIAAHLGYHALAVAYGAAALARVPHKTPEVILNRMKATDVGDEENLFEEYTPDELGTKYRHGLAQSLALLLDELADAKSPAHDPLALRLAGLLAFAAPVGVPLALLQAATGDKEKDVDRALRALHQRSIITLTTTAAMHRLTQSLVRTRMRRAGDADQSLESLLDALRDVYRWGDTPEEVQLDHTRTGERWAALPTANAVLAQVARASKSETASGRDAPMIALASKAVQMGGAKLQADLARYVQSFGQTERALDLIGKAIRWGESQQPINEQQLAVWRASRVRMKASAMRSMSVQLLKDEQLINKKIVIALTREPVDKLNLSVLRADRARIRQRLGDLRGAEHDISESISWAKVEEPCNSRLGDWHAIRADIRHDGGDFKGAEDDISWSIIWGEAQQPTKVGNGWYFLRSCIRRDRGDLNGAEQDEQEDITKPILF